MKKRAILFFSLFAMLLLTACIGDFDTPKVAQQGYFAIELETDSLVEEVETRAARELTYEEAKKYLVTLTQGEEVVWMHKKFEEITQADRTQPLGENYVVMAEDITEEEAESANNGWGSRRYAGLSETFSVVSKQTTFVTVPCRMANAGLSVVFDESFTSYFSDYAVTTDDLRALKFNTNGRIAYYNTDANGRHNLDIAISASAGWDGTVRLHRSLTLQSGKIIRLKVKLNSPEPTEGNISLSITYDNTFDDAGGEEIFLE